LPQSAATDVPLPAVDFGPSDISPLLIFKIFKTGGNMTDLLPEIWSHEEGQDVAEYTVMLAVILALVLVTIRLVGLNASTVFSRVGSTIQ
jgi:Flp pilus assembly pilin Flp